MVFVLGKMVASFVYLAFDLEIKGLICRHLTGKKENKRYFP